MIYLMIVFIIILLPFKILIILSPSPFQLVPCRLQSINRKKRKDKKLKHLSIVLITHLKPSAATQAKETPELVTHLQQALDYPLQNVGVPEQKVSVGSLVIFPSKIFPHPCDATFPPLLFKCRAPMKKKKG